MNEAKKFESYPDISKDVRSMVNVLFEARDELHQSATKDILNLLRPVVLTGICEYYKVNESDVEWVKVELMQGIVLLVGLASAKIGETLISNHGEPIKVTEQNVSQLQRYFQVGVPQELVETATISEIKLFFKKQETQALKELNEANELVHESFRGSEEDELDMIPLAGFDLNALTEEQKTFIFYNDIGTNTKKKQ